MLFRSALCQAPLNRPPQRRSNGQVVIGYFGLECAPRRDIENQGYASDWKRVLIHGSNYDPSVNEYIPAMLEQSSSAHSPSGTSFSSCNRGSHFGYALNGLYLRSGSVLNQVSLLRCAHSVASSTNHRFYSVNQGGWTGTFQSMLCPSDKPFVTGLYIRSGWLTDGISLECSP